MMKRYLTLLLIAAQLTALTSCGGSEAASDTTAADTTTVPVETADPTVPNFEYKDFGGADFTVAYVSASYADRYFIAEEETGDVMTDAVFQRNLAVEEAVNIHLQFEKIPNDDIASPLRAASMSGDDAYQLALAHNMTGIASMVIENMLVDLKTLPYIDFTKPYWNSACNETLEVGGHQYYADSDLYWNNTYGVYFNKTLIEEFKLEDPYELVRKNEWTIDKMIEMADGVTVDLNGDTLMDHRDQYGFSVLGSYPMSMFLWGADISLCEPETLELALMNERTVTLIEKLYYLIQESGSSYTWSFNDHQNKVEKRMLITSGRTLFNVNTLGSLGDYRDSDVDFGFVPMPKLESSQKDYTCVYWSGLMCVPSTIQDADMVGMVTELLAYYSGEITMPAFYNMVLGGKLARDEDMLEMLEYMTDHVVYDAGYHYFGHEGSMNNMFYSISNLICDQKSKDIASYYAKYEDSCNQLITEFWEAVKANG